MEDAAVPSRVLFSLRTNKLKRIAAFEDDADNKSDDNEDLRRDASLVKSTAASMAELLRWKQAGIDLAEKGDLEVVLSLSFSSGCSVALAGSLV
jgi:hypothetical protein